MGNRESKLTPKGCSITIPKECPKVCLEERPKVCLEECSEVIPKTTQERIIIPVKNLLLGNKSASPEDDISNLAMTVINCDNIVSNHDIVKHATIIFNMLDTRTVSSITINPPPIGLNSCSIRSNTNTRMIHEKYNANDAIFDLVAIDSSFASLQSDIYMENDPNRSIRKDVIQELMRAENLLMQHYKIVFERLNMEGSKGPTEYGEYFRALDLYNPHLTLKSKKDALLVDEILLQTEMLTAGLTKESFFEMRWRAISNNRKTIFCKSPDKHFGTHCSILGYSELRKRKYVRSFE